MPLIEIHDIERKGVDRAAVGRALNVAVADAIGARLDAVWTTWLTLDADVRGDDARTDVGASFGPIVHVFHHRTRAQVARIVEMIEEVLSRELDLAGNRVFVTTQPVEISDSTLD